MKAHRLFVAMATVTLSLLSFSPRVHGAGSTYRVATRYQPGGDGGWDYLTVDSHGKRLFVSRSTRVQVLSLADGKLLGEIQDTPGVHGIALAPDLHRGFTSNGRDSSVTVFDLATLAPVARVAVDGSHPDAILYEPVTHRIFTFNGGSANASVIDAATHSVIGHVPLGGAPEFAVYDGKGTVFVNIEDKSEMVAIDAATMKERARWSLAPGEGPSGLAIDRSHHLLFSVCDNQKMIVSDADKGAVIANLPIGTRVDGAAFDEARGLAFASCGQGVLTVVHEVSPTKFEVVENDSTQRSARTIALDPGTHRLYLPAAQFGPAPAPTADMPRPRPPMTPGSFAILVVER
jgi:YVTN family beta-propeller protein